LGNLITNYLPEIAEDIDFNTGELLDIDLKIKQTEPVADLKIIKYNLKEKSYIPVVFLFVLINEPYEIIPLTMYRLASDLHWYFTKNPIDENTYPYVIPVLLYNNEKDWTPKTLAELVPPNPSVPEFHYHFIDLKHGFSVYL